MRRRPAAIAVAFHMYVKTLREASRRPIYGGTFLGIPLVMMVIFGAALSPDDTAGEPPRIGTEPGSGFDDDKGLLPPVTDLTPMEPETGAPETTDMADTTEMTRTTEGVGTTGMPGRDSATVFDDALRPLYGG